MTQVLFQIFQSVCPPLNNSWLRPCCKSTCVD